MHTADALRRITPHRDARWHARGDGAPVADPAACRRLAAWRDSHPAGYLSPARRTSGSRLLYAAAGRLSVLTCDRLFTVAGHCALWLDPATEYRFRCPVPATACTLEFGGATRPDDADQGRLIGVSDLLRALLDQCDEDSAAARPDERRELLERLLLLEVRRAPRRRHHLPLPRNARLRAACRHVAGDLVRDVSLDHVAGLACMSRRTFTRLFRRETGLSFAAWHQHLRVFEAAALLDSGHSVTRAAFDVGYSTPRAFSAAFHRILGVLPSRYPACRAAGNAQ